MKGRSSAVSTSSAPAARASPVSIPAIAAWATGLRTKTACAMRSSVRSSTNRARPVSRRASSTRPLPSPALSAAISGGLPSNRRTGRSHRWTSIRKAQCGSGIPARTLCDIGTRTGKQTGKECASENRRLRASQSFRPERRSRGAEKSLTLGAAVKAPCQTPLRGSPNRSDRNDRRGVCPARGTGRDTGRDRAGTSGLGWASADRAGRNEPQSGGTAWAKALRNSI